jgi:hypothetical protein
MRGRAGLLGALLALLVLAAPAAMAQRFDIAPHPALQCLGVVPGAPEAPEFPLREFKDRASGGVQVLLEFAGPDRAPRVTVQGHTGQEAFVEAVLAHARQLRTPCLVPGDGPLRLVRDYQFRPDDRSVHWLRGSDPDAAAKRAALACVKHERGGADARPEFPRQAAQGGLQGRVLAQLRFDAPDQPPTAEVQARPSAYLFAESVERWVKGLRMPCHPGGGSIEGHWMFEFRLEGEGHFGFRPLSLPALLGSTRGIRQQTLAFDTTRMGCPFELEFSYRRPRWPNAVGELGTPDPARRPLLEWLETIELDLAPRLLDSVHGDRTRITVPCIRIDLKPKE